MSIIPRHRTVEHLPERLSGFEPETSFALSKLTAAEEEKIGTLVKKAVS